MSARALTIGAALASAVGVLLVEEIHWRYLQHQARAEVPEMTQDSEPTTSDTPW